MTAARHTDDVSAESPEALSREPSPSSEAPEQSSAGRRGSGCFRNAKNHPPRRSSVLESPRFRRSRKWILLALALLIVSLTSGLIYGWPALRSRLLREFPDMSEERLGLVYTLGSWSTQGGRFFIGLLRDKFGTRRVACGSLGMLALGLAGIAAVVGAIGGDNSSAAITAGLSVSLVLVGLGSGGQLCVQPVAGLFPDRTGVVLSSLSGAFQVSGLVFLVLCGLPSSHEAAVPAPPNLTMSFAIFGGVVLVLVVLSAWLLPEGTSFVLEKDDHEALVFENKGEENQGASPSPPAAAVTHPATIANIGECGIELSEAHDERQQDDDNDCNEKQSSETIGQKTEDKCTIEIEQPKIVDSEGAVEQPAKPCSMASNGDEESPLPPSSTAVEASMSVEPSHPTKSRNRKSRVSQIEASITAWDQIKTWEYVLLVTWFSVSLVPQQYYVGIIGFSLEALGDTTGVYTAAFNYCFAGAAVTAPLAGMLADRCGLGVAQGAVTGLMAVPFVLLALGLALPVQVVGLVGYGIGRMGIFGLYFTNCGKRFGYAHYGTLAGLGLLVSAVVSLLQYPLLRASVRGGAVPVQAGLAGLLLVQAPYFVWLRRRERRHPAAVGG